jgi:hypothetical protein
MAALGFFSPYAAALVVVSMGCGGGSVAPAAAPPPSVSVSTTTTAASARKSTTTTTAGASTSSECKISFVDIRVKDVSENGAYEAIGTVDLSKSIDNEPFALSERIRRRACLQGGEAVGVLATESGTGTEYIVVRHRRPNADAAQPASAGSSGAASKNQVKIDYFPNAK